MNTPIVAIVERTYRTSLVLGVLFTVLVGAGVAAFAVIAREDDRDLEIAGTLHMELNEATGGLHAAVAEELAEKAHSERHVEIWRGPTSLPPSDPAWLGAWSGRDACGFDEVGDRSHRVCASTMGELTVVVASPLAPLVREVLQIAGAIAVAGGLGLLGALVLGRRALRRTLAPLARFTADIARLPVRATREDINAAEALSPRSGVSEIEALATAFRGLMQRVVVAIEREQRFTADAAHELRSPLTRVRAQLELYQRETGEGGEPIAASIRTVDELSRMVEMLLALARDEVAVEEAVDLGDVVGNVLGRVAPESVERVRFETPDGEQPLVRGDSMLLELALGNLVDNALKYSSDVVDVSVSGRDPLEVVVTDRGPGLSYADASQVRLPFVRGDERPRSVRGSGIGLPLAEHVAHLHSGGLTLGNNVDGGLRASLRLPAWRPRERA